MKMTKKCFAVILSLAMILSFAPKTTFAAPTTPTVTGSNSITGTEGAFTDNGVVVKVSVASGTFAATPLDLKLEAAVTAGATTIKGATVVTKNGSAVIALDSTDLNTLPVGAYDIKVSSPGNADNNAVAATKVGTLTVAKKQVNVTYQGYNKTTVATVKDAKPGASLLSWSKSKYAKCGRKGYAFAGWTYNGTTVTKIPSSTKDITLVAKFTKMSVGQVKALSVKGKSGSGCGFVATSAKATKYGGRRGFRFRFSAGSMSDAIYKTTGLDKNVYTQTGLKKGRKYHVQVRYYYYDSSNQRFYGKYSSSKTVSAY